MILNLDINQLEWRAVVHLSAEQTGIKEIDEGFDFHTDNQNKFKLPTRLIAKKFLFRNIYCPWWIADRTSYAYSVDNEFKHIGGRKFWRNAIDKFYEKYEGIYEYHKDLKRVVSLTGKLISASGRIYEFEPRLRKGQMEWPDSDIVNYPVQGFSADLMSLARISAWRRLKEYREKGQVLFVNTVHDSLALDCDLSLRDTIEVAKIVRSSIQDIPANYKKIYGHELLVPMDGEAEVGINFLWVHKIKV